MSERRFTWSVEAPRYVDDDGRTVGFGELPQGELEQAALDSVAITRRMGGVVFQAPHRVEIRPDVFETAAVVFEWKRFAPAQRMPRGEPVTGTVERPEPDELTDEELEQHFPADEPAEVT